MDVIEKYAIFATVLSEIGTLAEWLGAGLQNRLRRFESARYLYSERLLFIRQPLSV